MDWELEEDLAVKKLQHSLWGSICEFDSSLEEPAKHVAVYNVLCGCYKNGPIKSTDQDWMQALQTLIIITHKITHFSL